MNKEQVLIDNFDKLGEEYKQKEFERIARENVILNKINQKTIECIKGIDFDYLDATFKHDAREYLELILEILEDKEV